MLKQYCIYTRDIVPKVMHELGQLTDTDFEMHLNRTRFWLDTQVPSHQRFYLRFGTLIHCVDHETDHATGT